MANKTLTGQPSPFASSTPPSASGSGFHGAPSPRESSVSTGTISSERTRRRKDSDTSPDGEEAPRIIAAPPRNAARRTARVQPPQVSPVPARVDQDVTARIPMVQDAKKTSRIALRLSQLLTRRRKDGRLSLSEVSSLSNIPVADIEHYEAGGRIPYDHAVILASIVGIANDELPGLRSEGGGPVIQAARGATRDLTQPLRLGYSFKDGQERLSRSADALIGISEFAIEILDDSLIDCFPRGSVLGFVHDRAPTSGDVVVARHKASARVALRRMRGKLLAGLAHGQITYGAADGWTVIARLVVAVFPA